MKIVRRILFYATCSSLVTVLAVSAVDWLWNEYVWGNFSWLLPVEDRPTPSESEVVMAPLSKIVVEAPVGKVTIFAGRGLKRTIDWEGGSRSVELRPRPERWYGSKGAYFPGPGKHWFPHHGIFRCVMDEGQLNFRSEGEALKYLAETPAYEPRIYRNDGLTVQVSKQSGTLGINLFQVYIKGRKPAKLPGAQDARIRFDTTLATPELTAAS